MVYNMMQKLQPARKTTSIIASVLVAGGMVVASSVLDSAPAAAEVDPTVPDDTASPADLTSTVVVLAETGPGTIANSGPTKIPEPSTLGALGLLAVAGVFGVGKKQKKM